MDPFRLNSANFSEGVTTRKGSVSNQMCANPMTLTQIFLALHRKATCLAQVLLPTRIGFRMTEVKSAASVNDLFECPILAHCCPPNAYSLEYPLDILPYGHGLPAVLRTERYAPDTRTLFFFRINQTFIVQSVRSSVRGIRLLVRPAIK